jgi:hypothetical protein
MRVVLKSMSVKQFRKLKARDLVCLLMGASLLSGCTSSMTSQLKESPCKTCSEKPVFYRNGEWLEGETK